MSRKILNQLTVRRDFWLELVVYIVGMHGLYIIATTLIDETTFHPGIHITDFDIDVPLLIGLGLVYLSTLLRRRKQTAWFVAILAYIFMLGFYANQIQFDLDRGGALQLIGKFGLPLVSITLLTLYRKSFTVRSDIRSFGYSLRFTIAILFVALIYGTAGFLLMDMRDFHQEISLSSAAHHTIDQFGLTTSTQLIPHTRRARLFVDSLSVVSVAAVTYAVISLFQPIRARYSDRHGDQNLAKRALETAGGNSEDFFKLWPHGKSYLFDKSGQDGIAYKIQRRVALIIGDPIGSKSGAQAVLSQFEDLCYGNDWLPFFAHTTPAWSGFYETHGYSLQKLGEEAVVDINHFETEVRGNKYFRQITNKFAREGMTSEVLLPPHSKALIQRLKTVSDDWLERPGRAERGLMMGYFDEAYLQQCTVVVARDSAGTIQAFLNQIPSYDKQEANFDMLRHVSGSLGNINDFVLLAFIAYLAGQPDIERLNLGLCPLAGLDDLEEKSAVSRAMHFVYSNGDRFYSFSGLRRFKSKYEPVWNDRYVAYKGGVRGLARGLNALTRAMRVKLK